MKKVVIYEPAMCCETGVCGTSVDPELLRMSSFIKNLVKEGYDIVRFNLSSAPKEFANNEKIKNLIKDKGEEVLPVTSVDGEFVITGRYPTNEEIEEIFEINLDDSRDKKEDDNSCGCSSSGCCC